MSETGRKVDAVDEASANEAAADAIKDECEEAKRALEKIKSADIALIKSMKAPPSAVKMVMESICVMFQVKCERRREQGGTGEILEDFWAPSKKLLSDPKKFLESLKMYDKDNISPSVMKKIREKYIANKEFDPVSIKKASSACEALCKWVRALEKYDAVAKLNTEKA